MKLKKQIIAQLDNKLVKSFNSLSILSNHSILVGSASYKNILYTSDFDLTETLSTNDGLNLIYKSFLKIFSDAETDQDYYIIDFKCGETINKDPIRWNFKNLKKGYQIIDGIKYNFLDCLKMNAMIKIDLVLILNGIFQEVSDVYVFNNNQKSKKDVIKNLSLDMVELKKEGNYFKALKRLFSIELLNDKVNKPLLDLFNSDYGRFYCLINKLILIQKMTVQKFKPLNIIIVKDNLQYIKQFGSNITEFNIDGILNMINDCCQINSKIKIYDRLEKIIIECQYTLNNLIVKNKIYSYIK